MTVKPETTRKKLTEKAQLRAKYRANRIAAAREGKMHFVGAVCGAGHSGLHYVSTGACVECVSPQRRNKIFVRLKENARQQRKAKLIEHLVALCD